MNFHKTNSHTVPHSITQHHKSMKTDNSVFSTTTVQNVSIDSDGSRQSPLIEHQEAQRNVQNPARGTVSTCRGPIPANRQIAIMNPPNTPPGGTWGQLHYRGKTTAIATIGGVLVFSIFGLFVACFKCDVRDAYLGPDGILYEASGCRIGPARRTDKFRPHTSLPYFMATPPESEPEVQQAEYCDDVRKSVPVVRVEAF